MLAPARRLRRLEDAVVVNLDGVAHHFLLLHGLVLVLHEVGNMGEVGTIQVTPQVTVRARSRHRPPRLPR